VLNLKRPRPLTDLSCDSSATEDALDRTTEIGVLLDKPVDEGSLPTVDMEDDGDIAKLHGIQNAARA